MAAKIYLADEAPLAPLQHKTVAILGYGSQGHAHALNAHESGIHVLVGLYPGSASWGKAEAAGLPVLPVAEAVQQADLVMFLLPDEKQRAVYEAEVRPHLRSGQALAWAHGFNIHYTQIVPPPEVDVLLIAPKAPGHRMREVFTEGKGVPSLVAVHQDASGQAWALAMAYGHAVGSARAGLIKTTFQEETETDLFGEQAVLCGGITHLIHAGWQTLVEAGYQPEVAYYECLNEMKLIVDLLVEGGFSRMRYSISDTAEYGDYVSGPRIIDAGVKQRMQEVLAEIQNGSFAHRWLDENELGRPHFTAERQRWATDPMEQVGANLRQLMQRQGLASTTG